MARSESGMLKAKELVPELREAFWKSVLVPGVSVEFNQSLERANRLADFLEFADLMVEDALQREESCGCHFNVAYQTEEHEALRNDESCCYVATWQFNGVGKPSTLYEEPLVFDNVGLAQRSYK